MAHVLVLLAGDATEPGDALAEDRDVVIGVTVTTTVCLT